VYLTYTSFSGGLVAISLSLLIKQLNNQTMTIDDDDDEIGFTAKGRNDMKCIE